MTGRIRCVGQSEQHFCSLRFLSFSPIGFSHRPRRRICQPRSLNVISNAVCVQQHVQHLYVTGLYKADSVTGLI